MEREILTYAITQEQMNDELSFVSKYFYEKGVNKCEVLFGFAWGNDYYPGNEWQEEEIGFLNLVSKVREVEASGIGKLGKDDLFIKVSGLEFRFCNDSDIHIYFNEPNDDVEFFYSRWKEMGYQPAEWLKNQEKGPGERGRVN